MITIHKFPFTVQDEFEIEMPNGAAFLHVDFQVNGELCLWAMVNTDLSKIKYRFRIYGTGQKILPGYSSNHVATFQQPPFVWHLFYVGAK